MSRIGKIPVPVPAGVDVSINGAEVTVKGPKGTLTHVVAEPIIVEQGDNAVTHIEETGKQREHIGQRAFELAGHGQNLRYLVNAAKRDIGARVG